MARDRVRYFRNEASLFSEIDERMREVPGMEGVALVSSAPGGQLEGGTVVRIGSRRLFTGAQTVSPGYFAVLSIPVVTGRSLASDATASSREIVVNEAFARESALG